MSMAVAREDDIVPPRHLAAGHARAVPGSRPAGGGHASERVWRVLVTDDNPGLRQTLNEILTHEGYVVEEAANGRAALTILQSSPIDVLILDLAMPLMDGVELLRQMTPPPPVVIIYSAFAYYDQEEVRRQVGAKVFKSLKKPVRPPELVASVADAVGELGAE